MLRKIKMVTPGVGASPIYQKRFGGGIDWRPGMLIQYAAAGIFFALGAMVFETRIVNWTPEFLFALCWLVIVLVVRCYLATLFPHKSVYGDASSEPVLSHSARDRFNGVGTFQRATGRGRTRWHGILRSGGISSELANRWQIIACCR